MRILGSTSFWAARLPYILLAGLYPVLSVSLARKMGVSSKNLWIAGGLGVFSGVYLVYASIPETFGPYLVLGATFLLLLMWEGWGTVHGRPLIWHSWLLGLAAGAMHLTRTDGILWASGGMLWILWTTRQPRTRRKYREMINSIGLYLAGYLLFMGAWYARNLVSYGTLMPFGNTRALWITAYNQTFNFPVDAINFSTWCAAGLDVHLTAWMEALSRNLGNLLVVQGMIFLLPLIIAGLWQMRRTKAIQFGLLLWAGSFLLMTVIFPYAGARGGYLHSGSAFQCLFWAAVPIGLERFVDWGHRKRNWQVSQALPTFGVFILVIAGLMTGWFYATKIVGWPGGAQWGQGTKTYELIGNRLNEFDANPAGLVMVNNPPGFYYATGRSSIVIPGGDESQLVAAARYYGAHLLILESGQENLTDLYDHPDSLSGLQYLGDIENARIFCFGCRE
jgi:hypothetical protein